MKKLLLFSALGALAFNASAQLATNRSIAEYSSRKHNQAAPKPQIDNSIIGSEVSGTKSTAKTTAGGTRFFSFPDYLVAAIGGSENLYSTNPIPGYMWHRGDAKAIYSDPASVSGLVADTIQLASYGVTFDPAFSGFSDVDVYDGTEIKITRATPYSVDSVIVYGVYGRNITKTSIVDTLRVAMVRGLGTGTDLPVSGFVSPEMKARYGSDTVRFAALQYDTATWSASGSTLVIKNILLTNASLADTVAGSGGVHRIAVPFSAFNVPAGQIVGVSVTFKTGEEYKPYVDTVFVGSMDATNPFRFGMFRPLIKEQATNTYPSYFPGAFNTGFVEFLPERATWEDQYLPSYAFTSDSFSYDIPLIEFVATCPTCKTIAEISSVKETKKIVSDVATYPNPANTELSVRFTTKESANVNVTVVNTLGQIVAVNNLGLQSAGQSVTTKINTQALPAGMYFYTIEASGQRTTSRFSVIH